MSCETIQPLLTSYLLDELIPREQKTVRAHLKTCDRCRAESEEIRATLSLLDQALAESSGAAPVLTEDRRATVFSSDDRSFWKHHGRTLQLAASISILLGVGLLLPKLINPDDSGRVASTSSMGPAKEQAAKRIQRARGEERTPFIELTPRPSPAAAAPDTASAERSILEKAATAPTDGRLQLPLTEEIAETLVAIQEDESFAALTSTEGHLDQGFSAREAEDQVNKKDSNDPGTGLPDTPWLRTATPRAEAKQTMLEKSGAGLDSIQVDTFVAYVNDRVGDSVDAATRVRLRVMAAELADILRSQQVNPQQALGDLIKELRHLQKRLPDEPVVQELLQLAQKAQNLP